jgi:WD40 repeat protein
VEYSPDGRYLATASEDSFRVWDCTHDYAPVQFEKDENVRTNVNGLAWRPALDRAKETRAEALYARTLVTVSDDCNIRVWHIPNTGATGGMEARRGNMIRGMRMKFILLLLLLFLYCFTFPCLRSFPILTCRA